MARTINQVGLDLIKQFEGCRLVAYRCPAGVVTIGYGWTRPIDGKPLTMGTRITQVQADALLIDGLADYIAAVEKACPQATDNQFAAMVSLAYNIGTGAFAKSSIAKLHHSGQHTLAADAFRRWNKAGGKVLPGLVRRREAERLLYLRST